ncbi:MAG: peptidoglycan-binding protein [Candidatus Zambryskibacteria bacterium]|nr:peptidoglycan-binding protein [Candidatus Zambryskibacteria bacterium]
MVGTKAFFPPYLNKGSRDIYPGGPVHFLGRLLIALRAAVPGFEVDGDYGPKMAESVKELQWRLGFVGDVVDGNFGPGTRAQLDKDFFIDVGSIPSGPGCDVWYIGPGGDEPVFWSAISNPVTGLSQPTA